MNRDMARILTGVVDALRDMDSRLSIVEALTIAYEKENEAVGNQLDRLQQDVTDLTSAEASAETRFGTDETNITTLTAKVAEQAAALEAAKAAGQTITPEQQAAIEAVTARLTALGQPAAPPAPVVPPTPAQVPAVVPTAPEAMPAPDPTVTNAIPTPLPQGPITSNVAPPITLTSGGTAPPTAGAGPVGPVDASGTPTAG